MAQSQKQQSSLFAIIISVVMLLVTGGIIVFGVSTFVNNTRVTISEGPSFEQVSTVVPTEPSQPTATPLPDPDTGSSQLELLILVNIARCDKGLSPVVYNPTLDEVGEIHAQDMIDNNFFDHQGTDGSSAGERATRVGYTWVAIGENLAAGQPTVEEAFDAWMNSRGHRENILEPVFREMGLSHITESDSNYGIYWVQIFGTTPTSGEPPSCP